MLVIITLALTMLPCFTCSDTDTKLQKGQGEKWMSRPQEHERFRRFQDDRFQDDRKIPIVTNILGDQQWTVLRKTLAAAGGNHRITSPELSDDRQISHSSVQSVITEDLGMRGVSAKFVPKLTTPSVSRKNSRVSVIQKTPSLVRVQWKRFEKLV